MKSEKQIKYLTLYLDGMTMREIANKFGVNESTISRVLKRAQRCVCPFSSNCEKCPLPDCAIKDEYAFMVNSSCDKRCIDKRMSKRKI